MLHKVSLQNFRIGIREMTQYTLPFQVKSLRFINTSFSIWGMRIQNNIITPVIS
jgi:hypothetical protein